MSAFVIVRLTRKVVILMTQWRPARFRPDLSPRTRPHLRRARPTHPRAGPRRYLALSTASATGNGACMTHREQASHLILLNAYLPPGRFCTGPKHEVSSPPTHCFASGGSSPQQKRTICNTALQRPKSNFTEQHITQHTQQPTVFHGPRSPSHAHFVLCHAFTGHYRPPTIQPTWMRAACVPSDVSPRVSQSSRYPPPTLSSTPTLLPTMP
mgnify:CR=1 FL=1